MRRLYLLRHAQAEHFSGRGDHGRRLTDHGRDQAAAVGATLVDSGIQVILASTAARAVETAQCLGLEVPISGFDSLYNGHPGGMLDVLSALPDEIDAAALVAHAPGVPALVHWLADGDSDAEALTLVEHRFPPATMAGLEFEGPWSDLASARLFVARIG